MKKALSICAALCLLLLAGSADAAYTSGTISGVVHTTFVSYTASTETLALAVGPSHAFTTLVGPMEVLEVRAHFTESGTTETITVFIDSGLGVNHDTVLSTQSMTGRTDFVFRPSPPCILMRNDALKVSCANAASKQWGACVFWRKL